MPDVHSIRLRHPWQCEPVEAGVCWLRSFNWPAGLTPREAAWLAVEGLPEGALVLLNGKPLGRPCEGKFDITAILAPSNRLRIELPGGELAEACPFDVRLEIEEG